MKRIGLLVAALPVLVVACSSMNVRSDYDRTVDFRRYRSYDWLPGPGGEAVTTMDDRRIKQAVNVNLLEKGLQINQDAPDLFVTYHTGQQNPVQVQQRGYTYGAWGGNVASNRHDVGTLIIDLIDARTNELIWRGTATDSVDPNWKPEKIEQVINEAVKKLLKDYPPKYR